MGEHEIREKYGGKLAKAINRAIRAEVPGGNEALDRLTQLAGAARQSHWEDKAGRPTPEAAAYFKHQRDVLERMEAQVRQRWRVPPARPSPVTPTSKGAKNPRTTGAKNPRATGAKNSSAAGAKNSRSTGAKKPPSPGAGKPRAE